MNTTQRSQHQPATNLLQVVVNVNKKGEKSKCHCLLLGVKSFVVMFNKFESLCEPLKRKKKKKKPGSSAYLNPNECGPDVQTGICGVRHPLLVHLHQLLNAFQQLGFIKQLGKGAQARGCNYTNLGTTDL